MDKPSDKCSLCYDYEERAAILEYLAHMTRAEAQRKAREIVCWACSGERGIDILYRVDDGDFAALEKMSSDLKESEKRRMKIREKLGLI